MIEKLVLGGIWTGDLLIFNLDALTSAPSRQAYRYLQFRCIVSDYQYQSMNIANGIDIKKAKRYPCYHVWALKEQIYLKEQMKFLRFQFHISLQ